MSPFGDLYCPAVGVVWRYHSVLSNLLGKPVKELASESGLEQFERILTNTAKIVKDRGIQPEDEAAVRKCVYDLLVHVFPDTVREIPVAQVSKTYRPDIGVKSLKAAAEYKFADSEDDVEKAIGGLYEDMRGYAGSADWTRFYAVVYMTDAFFTVDQIKAEFKHTKADENWVPILVVGRGSRVKRVK